MILLKLSRPLKGFADLRQLAFKVVTQRKSATDGDEGQAFFARSQTGMNAEIRIGRDGCTGAVDQRGVGSTGETDSGGGAAARILHQTGDRRSVEFRLAFTEIGEAGFVHRSRAQRPGVRDIDLLGAGAKSPGKLPRLPPEA